MYRNICPLLSWKLVLVAVCCLAVRFESPAAAQLSEPGYQVGDLVEADGVGGPVPGQVVDVNVTSGLVKVRFDESDVKNPHFRRLLEGRGWVSDFFPHQVRPRPDAAATPKRQQLRTWTDRSGRFKIVAHLVDLQSGKVRLERADGRQLEVPLERLSDADARYARRALTREAADAPQQASSPQRAPILQPATFKHWTFAPELSPTPELPEREVSVIEIGHLEGTKPLYESVEAIYLSRDGRTAWLIRAHGTPGSVKPCFLQIIDLSAGVAGAPIPLPTGQVVLDALPEAGLMVGRIDEQPLHPSERLKVWRVDGERLTVVHDWVPYEKETIASVINVHSAWLLGPDQLMTTKQHGDSYHVWSIADSPQARYRIPMTVGTIGQAPMALSDDRRLMAVAYDEAISIIDLMAGRHVANIASPGQTWATLRFRPDNQVLAGFPASSNLIFWDLRSGEVADEFSHEMMRGSRSFEWLGNEAIVAGTGCFLFDVSQRTIVWCYSVPNSARGVKYQSRQLAYVPSVIRDDQPAVMVVLHLPLEDARAAFEAVEKGAPNPGAKSKRSYGWTWLESTGPVSEEEKTGVKPAGLVPD